MHVTVGIALLMFGANAVPESDTPQAPANLHVYSSDEVIAVVIDRLTSIDSLDCEFTVQYRASSAPAQHRIARDGRQWHWAVRNYNEPGGVDTETIFCSDGEFVYAVYIRRREGEDDKWSIVEVQDRKRQEQLDPDSMLGLKLSNIGRSLPDALTLIPVTAVDTQVDDEVGIRLSARGVPSAEMPATFDLEVVLDPRHDLLPREILITAPPPDDGSAPVDWKHHWKVLEYRQVIDESTRRNRWFPVSGILEQGSAWEPIRILVSSARINPKLEPELFRPAIPDGVLLADKTSDGTGRLAIKGGNFVIDRRMEELTKQSQLALKSASRLWVVALNLVLVILVVSVILFRRWRFPKEKQ